MNRSLFAPLIVMLLTPWWWIIIQRNPLAGILVFILSLVIFAYFWQTKSTKILLLLVILTASVLLIAIKEAFDGSIFISSALDIQQYNKRHEFYAIDLGKIYTNRFSLTFFKDYSLPLYKLQRNFFSNLDPNLYFFNSHPRERLGVEEFSKYFPFFLPFFIIGIFYSIYALLPKFLVYLVLVSLLSSIISPSYNLGPILFLPVINFMVTSGLILGGRYFVGRFWRMK